MKVQRESATVSWKKKKRPARYCRKAKVIAEIPKWSKWNYDKHYNAVLENSHHQCVIIIKRVSWKSGLYLPFLLCVNLFLTRGCFLLLANEPAASPVLIVAQ